MKLKFMAALLVLAVALSGCANNGRKMSSKCAAARMRGQTIAECEAEAVDIYIAKTPQNRKSQIFLVNQNTGDIACCRDTKSVSAEECARALEQECFKRVEDIPFGVAGYDALTTNTYPTRRWRENEKTPRW